MGPKRKVSCGNCEGCNKSDCGKCVYCLDKPKFGGKSRLRQRCRHRKCSFKLDPRNKRADVGAYTSQENIEIRADPKSVLQRLACSNSHNDVIQSFPAIEHFSSSQWADLGKKHYPIDDILNFEKDINREKMQSYKINVRKRMKLGMKRLQNRKLMLLSRSGHPFKGPRADHGDEFELSAFRKKQKPAKCIWKKKCCLCRTNVVSPRTLNIKRKSTYIREYGQEVSTKGLDRMTTNWVADLTAHLSCLVYAAGEGMVQTMPELCATQPQFYLEGFPVDQIRKVMEASKSKKSRCVYCKKPRAASQCANQKCTKEGWYHLPCGMARDSHQNKEYQTFCSRHGIRTPNQVLECNSQLESKKRNRKLDHGTNPSQDMISSQDSLGSTNDGTENQQIYEANTSIELGNYRNCENNPDNKRMVLHRKLETICWMNIHPDAITLSEQDTLREDQSSPSLLADIEENLQNQTSTMTDLQYSIHVGDPIDEIQLPKVPSTMMEMDEMPKQCSITTTDDLNLLFYDNCTELKEEEIHIDCSEPEKTSDDISLGSSTNFHTKFHNKIIEYEKLMEMKDKEIEKLEEKHKCDIEIKHTEINILEDKIKLEKNEKKKLLDGKKIQIELLEMDNTLLRTHKRSLIEENHKLKKDKEDIVIKSSIEIDKLQSKLSAKIKLIDDLRYLSNIFQSKFPESDDTISLGNEYIEPDLPDPNSSAIKRELDHDEETNQIQKKTRLH